MKPFAALLLLFALLGRPLAQSAQLFTVSESGPRSARINMVFLSEGYTAADLPKFAGHVQSVVNFLFAREPWKPYRAYCNVYRIEIASNQSGCDNGDASGPGGLRDTYFGTGFNNPGVVQLLTLSGQGSSRAFSLLNQWVPEYDVPIVLVNDTKYGGSGGPLAVASVNVSSAAIVEHELGHSFAGLADEYDLQFAGFNPSEMPNTTAQTDRNLIRWKHWIEAATPIPTPELAANDAVVGLFEGSMYRTNGWFRPHNNSLMRNLNRPVGAVNREQFILNFYRRVSVVDGFAPATNSRPVTGPEALSFSVEPKNPETAQGVGIEWLVDGVVQAGVSGTNWTVPAAQLGNGDHTVTARVRDLTTFVRADPAKLLEDSVTWSLSVSGQAPDSLAVWRAAYGPDEATPAGDGVPNLLKYALGLNPLVTAGRTSLPTFEWSGDFAALRVPRAGRREDVEYVVQFSSDLVTWDSGAPGSVTVEDSPALLLVRDAASAVAGGQRFLRLLVRPRAE